MDLSAEFLEGLKINQSLMDDFWKINAMHSSQPRLASKFPTTLVPENFTDALTTVATTLNTTLKPEENCTEYCVGTMQEISNEYRTYHHGYVSLIVSSLNIYTTRRSILIKQCECFQICVFGTIANILNIIILTRKEMSKTPINSILKCEFWQQSPTSRFSPVNFCLQFRIKFSSLRLLIRSIFSLFPPGLAVCDMFVMMEYIPFGWHMYLTTKGET